MRRAARQPQSLLLDLWILLRTIGAVIGGIASEKYLPSNAEARHWALPG